MNGAISIFCRALLVFSLLGYPRMLYPQETLWNNEIIESMEFREVDIKDVLRQLSKQYGMNIVFSEKVTGLITIQLNNVSLEKAIDSIITVNGFVYTKKGSIIKVTTADEAERELKQTRLFKLNNAEAARMKETLNRVLTPDGSIDIDTRSNSIVITDTLSTINKIEDIIPQLDNPTPQVMIEAKIIETSLTKTDKLGIDWTTTLSATGAKRPTTLPFQAKGERGWMENVFPPASLVSPTAFPTGHPYAFPAAAAGDFELGTIDASGLKSIFDFLQKRSNTKLIANPRLVTLNNQKAIIHVGKEYPLPIYERNETSGSMEIIGWANDKKVGVKLEVTPQISPDGHIKLSLKPEVSSFDSWLQVDGKDAAPITSTRNVETEVLIKNGQTVVIGGLIKNESVSTVSKIPILGDIPILGFFFSRRDLGSTSPAEKTDLLIFVTAHIIKDTDAPLIASESQLITSLPRPFKLDLRNISVLRRGN